MTTTIATCPHCGAPLAPTRFATTVVCSFCDATVRIDPTSVSARKYREAWTEWNDPGEGDDAVRFSIAGTHWATQRLLAHGEIADVYLARRARWPSELVVLKVVRAAADSPLIEQEWRSLERLRAAAAEEHVELGSRVPAPVVMGVLEKSAQRNMACAYRWAGGFEHTFEAVRDVHRRGIDPVASIWVWRRILEIIGVMKKAGLVHGAILPNHLLVETDEHGVRLVGFSCADSPHAPLRVVSSDFTDFYPASILDSQKLTAAADVMMSARCVSYLLGGHPGHAGDRVPRRLAELLERAGTDEKYADLDVWKLHKEVGDLGKELFGPPGYHPIPMT
jgi:hypothetical protein